MRPVLKPGLRRLWRDDGTLQLGVDPGPAVVLAGVEPGAAALLDLIDGTRDRDALVREGCRHGLDPTACGALLEALAAAGALDDAAAGPGPLAALPPAERDRLAPEAAAAALALRAPGGSADVLGRRRRAVVAVDGLGRLGASAAVLLAAAGVGTLVLLDDAVVRPADLAPGGAGPRDLGRPRAAAVADGVAAAAPGCRVEALTAPPTRADLVVLARPVQPADGEALARAGLPHLAVQARGGGVTVGPLVLPGRSACLRCLDLARVDRDPQWPRLAAQLAGGAPGGDPLGAVGAALAAALAAQQALALVDGRPRPETVDGTLELAPPDWLPRRRTRPPHPACGCRLADTG